MTITVADRKAWATRRHRAAAIHAQTLDAEPVRQHIGKIGAQPLADSILVKGWVGLGGYWQGYMPRQGDVDVIEAAVSQLLGTDDWGYQSPGIGYISQ